MQYASIKSFLEDRLRTSTDEIAYEILKYLNKNRDAQDTLEGIVEWWLLEQQIDWNASMVEEAISYLVSQGLLVKRRGENQRAYYSINRSQFKRIAELLKNREKQ